MTLYQKFIEKRLTERAGKGLLRSLQVYENTLDFFSNDYLSMARISMPSATLSGGTGSRLISGNSKLKETTESFIAEFYGYSAALCFNSGYDANLGVFSSLLTRNTAVVYDELCHASIRDGIRLGMGKSIHFKHNNIIDLENKLTLLRQSDPEMPCLVAIETIYSMDGDAAPVEDILELCSKYNAMLIADEAHAIGISGIHGKGLMFPYSGHPSLPAVVITFGKAFGLHGAAVLGSSNLIQYLVNYSRSFIYTTALPDNHFQLLKDRHLMVATCDEKREQVKWLTKYIVSHVSKEKWIITGGVATIISLRPQAGIDLKSEESRLLKEGFAVKAIFPPTVPENSERLRISVHAHNTQKEVNQLIKILNS